jgi:hypothetical protein
MNVIVDVRGMNVNMRVNEDPIEGFTFSAKGAAFTASLGQRPQASYAQKHLSAESAIHFRPILFHR